MAETTYYHTGWFQLDAMAFLVNVLELGRVARDDASLPWPHLVLVHCGDHVARVDVQIPADIPILERRVNTCFGGTWST